MANRFLPIYLFLLLLGTAAPLWAQGGGHRMVVDQNTRRDPGGSPYVVLYDGFQHVEVAEINAAVDRGWTFPARPDAEEHLDPNDPSDQRLIQEIRAGLAFEDLSACMERELGDDYRERGTRPESVEELRECNEEVFGQKFTMEYVRFGEDHPQDYYDKLLEVQRQMEEKQCIAMLHIAGDIGKHVVTLRSLRRTQGNIEAAVRTPYDPVGAPGFVEIYPPSDSSSSGSPSLLVRDYRSRAMRCRDILGGGSVEPPLQTSIEKFLCQFPTALGYYIKCPVSEEETTEEKGLED